MLAFYILVMIASCIIFVIVIYDTSILGIASWQNKAGQAAKNIERVKTFCCGMILTKTIWVKILLICYFLVTIPNQALFINPPSNTTAAVARAVMRFLGVILLLFAYSQAVFTCIEILLKARVFGDRRDAVLLRIFKWFFFTTNGIPLLAANAMVIVFAVYLRQAQDFDVVNLPQLAWLGKTITGLAQAIMLTLLCTQGLMMIETALLLSIVTWKLSKLDKRVRGMKNVIGRVAGLWMAWFCGLPNLGLLAFITPVISWITTGAIQSYWSSVYQTNIAYLWLIFGDFATELLWICAIVYAIRTRAKRGWLQAQFATLLGKKTMVEENTASGSSSGSTATGGLSGASGISVNTINTVYSSSSDE